LRVKRSFLREREGTRITSKRLMITRTENLQVSKGHIYTQRLDESGNKGQWHRHEKEGGAKV